MPRKKKVDPTDPVARESAAWFNKAVEFVKGWAQTMVAKYQEPSRAGTPKGDPIGLSSQKYHAAMLMVLHPTLRLKEIGEIAGVSEGVLRVWRTDPAFKKTVEFGYSTMVEFVKTLLENEFILRYGVDEIPSLTLAENERSNLSNFVGRVLRYITYLNPDVCVRVMVWLAGDHKDRTKRILAATVAMEVFRIISSDDSARLREFERQTSVMKITKKQIEVAIGHLSDPESWKEENRGETLRLADGLKSLIYKKLDILAR